jgi:hypothetical protein
MWVAIVEAIVAFLKTIPIFMKYFPPKTPTEKEQDGEKEIVDEIKKGQETGRPGA